MKQAATNLPTLPTGIKVRKVRGANKLALVFLAPEPVVEQPVAADPVIQSPAYAEAARQLDELTYALEQEFARLAQVRPSGRLLNPLFLQASPLLPLPLLCRKSLLSVFLKLH